MKYINLYILFLTLAFTQISLNAQQRSADGFFTSEGETCATDTGVFVSIKKYNPTQAEIDNASKPSKSAPMNYLMAPFEATNISLFDNGFESKLYSLNKLGKVSWDVTIGYSNKSVPSPLKLYKGFVFTGESTKDRGKVAIQKIDLNGSLIWRTVLDSLHNVNDLHIDDNRVSALVSFDARNKIYSNNGTVGEHIYPIYFFVQLDMTTGNKIVKEYQSMANYMSSLGFSDPFLNTDYSYYLNNKDSAVFFNTSKLESATVVSTEMSKDNSIIKLVAGENSYHLLTVKAKKRYNLICDFYGRKEKYDTELPIEYTNLDRAFVNKVDGDSIITIISNDRYIAIMKSGPDGKLVVSKKVNTVISPVISAGTISGKTYILQMEGRMKPGTTGRIRLEYY